jgi:hypothetical protein
LLVEDSGWRHSFVPVRAAGGSKSRSSRLDSSLRVCVNEVCAVKSCSLTVVLRRVPNCEVQQLQRCVYDQAQDSEV